MADEWYYTNQGQQLGPVSTADLKQMAASNRLQPTDLVWKEGLAKWVPASTAKGLFPDTPPAAAARAEPFSDSPVAEVADEEARPRRRRRFEDDEDEERPRRRPARAAGGMGVGLILLIVGGIVFLLIGGVVVVLVLVLNTGVRSGPGNYTVDLSPDTQDVRQVYWNSGYTVNVTVTSERDSDVDLIIEDANGRLVAADRTVGPNSVVRFVAPHSGNYRVIVQNLGPGSNRSHVRHN